MKKNLLSLPLLLLITFCTYAQTTEVEAFIEKFIDKDSATVQKDLISHPEVTLEYNDGMFTDFGGKKGQVTKVTLKPTSKISLGGKPLNGTFLISDIMNKYRINHDFQIINNFSKDKKTYILLKYHYRGITFYNSTILLEASPTLFTSEVLKDKLYLKDPSKIKDIPVKIVQIGVINESVGLMSAVISEGRGQKADPLMKAKILIQNKKYTEAKKELENIDTYAAISLKLQVMTLLSEYAEAIDLINKKTSKADSDYPKLHELYLLSGQSKKIIPSKTLLNKVYYPHHRILFVLYSALADLEATGSMGTAEKNIIEVLPFMNFKDFEWDLTMTKNYIETSSKIKAPAKAKAIELIKKIEAANY